MALALGVLSAPGCGGCASCNDHDDAGADAGVDGGVRDGGVDAGADGGATACETAALPALTSVSLAPGHRFQSPVFMTQAPGDDATFYVVEQGNGAAGHIRVVRDGKVLDAPFLTVPDLGPGLEEGLLGLAFHPDYASNGRFFVYYVTAAPRHDVLAEYARESADRANPTEVRRLVDLPDKYSNHNGGMITFGPDGMLYLGIGDGGSGGDPDQNGQNPTTLFGTILRLDVDAASTDFAAAGNPFSEPAGAPQVWLYCLRNPWRFSFDRKTNDLYIGDVGQNRFEEVDVLPAGSRGGVNYGWSAYEGDSVYNQDRADRVKGPVTPPVLAYAHGSDPVLPNACSITGGYVYRGAAIPALDGFYLFSDYCSDRVAAFKLDDKGEACGYQAIVGLAGADVGERGVASFAEDHQGELYVVYRSGDVRRIVAPD